MTNTLENWVKDHQKELEEQKAKEEQAQKKARKLTAETTIVLKDVTEITETTFKFGTGAEEKEVKRYFYHTGTYNAEDTKTHPYLIPKSVHYEICNYIKEYGKKLTAVKIKPEGTGKNTQYKLYPQLN